MVIVRPEGAVVHCAQLRLSLEAANVAGAQGGTRRGRGGRHAGGGTSARALIVPRTRQWKPGGRMGFWGTYIVARADQELPELPALRPSAESVMWHGRGPGGWQAVQVHRGPDGWESAELSAPWEATLIALMEQAGHPGPGRRHHGQRRCPARRVQSRGRAVGGWLMLDRIIGHIVPDAWPRIVAWDDEIGPLEFESVDDEDYQRRHQSALDRMHAVGPPAAIAAPLAVTWASEAGLQPDPVTVEAALEASDIFCEDVFFGLLAALGVPDLTSEVTSA